MTVPTASEEVPAPGVESGGGVVVLNPGSIPEIPPVANALAGAGRLGRYYAPLAMTPARLRTFERRMPRFIREAALAELEKRPIPPGVPEAAVREVGTFANLAMVAAARFAGTTARRLRLSHRNDEYFDARVARDIDRSAEAVLTVAGSALRTLSSAR